MIFDVDPEFNNTEEWYQSIPMQVRPRKDQPFYHLLAEAPSQPSYVAYVSQQNLVFILISSWKLYFFDSILSQNIFPKQSIIKNIFICVVP